MIYLDYNATTPVAREVAEAMMPFILEEIPGLCASTGAACEDRSVTISHVLAAMGVSREIGMGAIRLTLGRPTTEDEIDQVAKWIVKKVKR
jgi:cysteine desulfurase